MNASFGHTLNLSDPMGLPSINVTIAEFIEFHFELTQELERLKVLAKKRNPTSRSEDNIDERLLEWRHRQPDSCG